MILSLTTPIFADVCQFPAHWAGSWFQKGVPDAIRIINGNISEKGICRESNGDKFLIENRNEKCVRCMVINEKHVNVLQYKETYYCHPINSNKLSLEQLCSEINGDAPLLSLFRLETSPVSCPFTGPFTFSYSRGPGECRDPISTIDSCTDTAHLLFKFQACADVYGSESRVEELECFADWKEGSVRYLVGKMHHRSAKTDEDKFRCFVFEKSKDDSGYSIAQSGDATCDGLLSPTEGSRTMKITKATRATPRCHFPKWLTSHKHWKTLDGLQLYDFGFSRNNNSFRVFNITNGEIVRQTMCIHDELGQSNNDDAFSQFTVHFTSGCESGFVCMRIYKRGTHVIEIQTGNPASQVSDACGPHNFRLQTARYLTLTTVSPETKECPFDGIYAVVPGGTERPMSPSSDRNLFICSEQSSLNARCKSLDHMQLQSRCSFNDATRNFRCHGGWEENGTHFLIAYSNEDKLQYCLTYNREHENQLQMTISSATCFRNMQLSYSSSNPHTSHKENHVALNLLSKGLCNEVGGSTAVHIIHWSFLLKLIIIQTGLCLLLRL